MIEKRPFEAADLVKMECPIGIPVENENLFWFGKGREPFQPNVTFLVEGSPMACGGLCILWPGMAEVWMVLSGKAGYHVVIEVKKHLNGWFDEYHLFRLQAMVFAGWEVGVRFLRWLGMEEEGRMRKFGRDASDYLLYSRVK